MDRFLSLLALCTFALMGSLAAQTLELTESAHELKLGDITMPGSTAGTLIFQSCDTCDRQSLRVNANTSYVSPEGPMPLADFLDYVADVRLQSESNQTRDVTVFRSMNDDSVTRVELHARN